MEKVLGWNRERFRQSLIRRCRLTELNSEVSSDWPVINVVSSVTLTLLMCSTNYMRPLLKRLN